MRAEQAARDVLPGHPLARHIDDFLTDLANANKPRNTIRAYRGDLIGFAAHHDGDIAALTPRQPQRPGRPAVLRRGAQQVEEILCRPSGKRAASPWAACTLVASPTRRPQRMRMIDSSRLSGLCHRSRLAGSTWAMIWTVTV
jgi:hypothetical protein